MAGSVKSTAVSFLYCYGDLEKEAVGCLGNSAGYPYDETLLQLQNNVACEARTSLAREIPASHTPERVKNRTDRYMPPLRDLGPSHPTFLTSPVTTLLAQGQSGR
ncbi:hypothetical protein CDAR_202741 [Caerostris darwini]|uniref:Uncharacterized protein n=1 Tax=Caerostris darwini TaxID=1538125 RepID=A0AAV4RPD4_9ARAC|nr:hypothetical protein CDAR_202741 [Caerostris darwini]